MCLRLIFPSRLLFKISSSWCFRSSVLNMHFRLSALCVSGFFIFWRTAFSAPAQPALSNHLNAGSSSLVIDPSQPLNHSVLGGGNSSSVNGLTDEYLTWPISDTLQLAVTICNWAPDPATIMKVLTAAHTAIGKKPAAGLLDGTFTQKSDNRFNTLLFEISPGDTYKRLTWGDVGEVLGENGLPKFYDITQEWHTIYFTVLHKTRDELGTGAVRRWWQLDPFDGVNGIAMGNECAISLRHPHTQ